MYVGLCSHEPPKNKKKISSELSDGKVLLEAYARKVLVVIDTFLKWCR